MRKANMLPEAVLEKHIPRPAKIPDQPDGRDWENWRRVRLGGLGWAGLGLGPMYEDWGVGCGGMGLSLTYDDSKILHGVK